MNKKGFTLMELLAVIVILGALSSIAVVSYEYLLNKSKNTIYKDEEKSIKGAAESYLTHCSTLATMPDYCTAIPKSGETIRITLAKLQQAKFMDKIKDSQNGAAFCDGYVNVKNEGTSIAKINYEVCLKCSNYQSSDCE